MAQFRKERVNDLVLEFLGTEVRRMLDPRLQLVTLTSVKMSADLRRARVFWTEVAVTGEEFPDGKHLKETQNVLIKAGTFLRRRIGQELKLRYTPELLFQYDDSIETGIRIDSLLDKVTR